MEKLTVQEKEAIGGSILSKEMSTQYEHEITHNLEAYLGKNKKIKSLNCTNNLNT